jgi:L-2-hydroxycarboxylate dehydrogenase (NAD+)
MILCAHSLDASSRRKYHAGHKTMNKSSYRKANAKRLERFASQALQKAGVNSKDAELAAEMIVDADLRGIDTHGVMNLHRYYVRKVKNGIINAAPSIKTIQGSPTTAVMDGDNGLGFIVGHAAMRKAIDMAGEFGSGWVSAHNSNHCGAGTYYVLMAVKENMLGIHFSSGGTSVAGPGGVGRLIGNNVIALAAPADKYAPFVFDMAPAMSIANKAHLLAWDRKKFPEGFVIDGEGNPVTDPEGYFNPLSAVLPLGSSVTHGAHKGFGLLLLTDILTGVLSGDGGSMLRKKGAESHAFCALRIEAFSPLPEFKKLMDEMIEKLHSAKTQKGREKIRYPGERADSSYKERAAHGIPLHPKVVEDLSEMGAAFGISINDIWEK